VRIAAQVLSALVVPATSGAARGARRAARGARRAFGRRWTGAFVVQPSSSPAACRITAPQAPRATLARRLKTHARARASRHGCDRACRSRSPDARGLGHGEALW
jgi:hypothetical protein